MRLWLVFEGDLEPKQCIPNKQTKYGVKAFTLVDSKNLDILLYTGGDTLDNSDSQQCHLPQPARIVLILSNDYLDQGRTIFTDRYYTSIPLATNLRDASNHLHWNLCEQLQINSSEFSSKEFSFSRWRSSCIQE